MGNWNNGKYGNYLKEPWVTETMINMVTIWVMGNWNDDKYGNNLIEPWVTETMINRVTI